MSDTKQRGAGHVSCRRGRVGDQKRDAAEAAVEPEQHKIRESEVDDLVGLLAVRVTFDGGSHA